MATLSEVFKFENVTITSDGMIYIKKRREIVKGTDVIMSVPHRDTYENEDLIDYDNEIPNNLKADIKTISKKLKGKA